MSRFLRGFVFPLRAHRNEGALDSPSADDLQSTVTTLLTAAPPEPVEISLATSRRRLLSSLETPPVVDPLSRRYLGVPATVAALVLLFTGVVGAGAASGNSPVSEVLGALGLATSQNDHGTGVRDSVHDAIASSTPGPSRGEAVSLAACEAAHDRENLPDGAKNAPGQEDKDLKECGTPEAEDEAEGPDADAQSSSDHGQAVQDVVHGAIDSTTPGPERGQAVSEAACTAAHDRTNLPDGAQNAPGKDGDQAKDCTHPNTGDGAGTQGNGQGSQNNPAPKNNKP